MQDTRMQAECFNKYEKKDGPHFGNHPFYLFIPSREPSEFQR